MEPELKRVVRRYAIFLVLFSIAVYFFTVYGAEIFAVLLHKSRAYTPPQFLTWLSLASSLSVAAAFCAMPFLLFRIVRERSDVPFGWVVLCLAGFLFLSGASAFLGLLNIWFHGPIAIWTLVLTHLGSALLAVATLLILQALVPRILTIPTKAEWLHLQKDVIRAEARAEEKDKLLAAVSHELRTPLAPLLASLTELEHRLASSADTEIKDCLQVLRTNVQKEARLVSALIERLEIPGTPPPSADLELPAADLARPRLLLVEDHLDTLRIFARSLRRQGFEVQEASSVSEAAAAARRGDFLISDIALPDGDGCELMQRLAPLGVVGIAVSGFGTSRDQERYRNAGFAESFVKPVEIPQVVSAITRVLSLAKP
ncbi:MAG TPA: response regulator [Chthoniobacterales bacterium]|nr:response regulator [Chthoniobacterales bacterium]